MFGVGILGSLGGIGASVGPSFDPAAAAYFARIPTQTPTRYALLNTVFVGLRATGILSLLDCLWLMAAADATTAKANLISSSFTLTPVSAPVFAADRGYTGDGSSSFLDTGFNPSTAAGKYTLNSAHISFYDRTTRAAVTTIQMGVTSSQFGSCIAGNVISETLNSSASNSPANTQSAGFFVGDRPSSASLSAYRNGTLLGTSSVASTSIPVSDLTLCARGGIAFFSSDQIAQASIGASLGPTLTAQFYSIIQAYMTGVGAQV